MAERKSKNFEQKISEIEKIVSSLEQKNLELEQSLELFEKGTALIRECQKTLFSAEQKISSLNIDIQNESKRDVIE
jgi:exodeoxyribonuclease VII small subunit